MSRLVAALTFVSLGLAANCQDAKSIIAKVAARHKALDAYYVEGAVDVYHTGGGRGLLTLSKFLIQAANKCTKLHIEYHNPGFSIVFITDGSNMWTHVPHERVYTKIAASAVTQDANGEQDTGHNDNIAMSVYSMAVRRYANLDQLPAKPELMGQAKRYLVLRSETSFGQGGTTTHMRVSIKRFDIGPPDTAAFSFVPDKHAKLVDELSIPGARPTFVGKPAIDFALKKSGR